MLRPLPPFDFSRHSRAAVAVVAASAVLAAPVGLGVTAVLLALMAAPTAAHAQTALTDPPGRVARLNRVEGIVSFLPADDAAPAAQAPWQVANLNRPLTTGDRLWTDSRARAELHLGGSTAHLAGQTSLDFLLLDDNTTQLRLARGTLVLRVRSLAPNQRLEIDTPNLALVITQPGEYRIDANPSTDTTRVVVQSGSGQLYGDGGASLPIGNQQQGSFSGTQLAAAAPGASVQDGFDAWAQARDRLEDQSVSARYVSRETIGYQQLDSFGDWRQDATYGPVWLPRNLPAQWAPFRAGHWDWVTPWGWTWIDDAPWGFAPFHYGRWAQIGPSWAWVPPRLAPRPVYAPALVGFIGGFDVGFGGGFGGGGSFGGTVNQRPEPGVGWFPLAPGEALRPHYRTSPRYITQINSTVVNGTVVNNTVFNGPADRYRYRYQGQPEAVSVLSANDFARGQRVQLDAPLLAAGALAGAQLMGSAATRPGRGDRENREIGGNRNNQGSTSAAGQLPPRSTGQTPPVGQPSAVSQTPPAADLPERLGNGRLRGDPFGLRDIPPNQRPGGAPAAAPPPQPPAVRSVAPSAVVTSPAGMMSPASRDGLSTDRPLFKPRELQPVEARPAAPAARPIPQAVAPPVAAAPAAPIAAPATPLAPPAQRPARPDNRSPNPPAAASAAAPAAKAPAELNAQRPPRADGNTEQPQRGDGFPRRRNDP